VEPDPPPPRPGGTVSALTFPPPRYLDGNGKRIMPIDLRAALVAKFKKLATHTDQLVAEHNKPEARVERLENLLVAKLGSRAEIQE